MQEWLGHANIVTTRIYDRRRSLSEDSLTFKVWRIEVNKAHAFSAVAVTCVTYDLWLRSRSGVTLQ